MLSFGKFRPRLIKVNQITQTTKKNWSLFPIDTGPFQLTVKKTRHPLPTFPSSLPTMANFPFLTLMVLTTDDNDRIIPFSYHILMTNSTRYIPKQGIFVTAQQQPQPQQQNNHNCSWVEIKFSLGTPTTTHPPPPPQTQNYMIEQK